MRRPHWALGGILGLAALLRFALLPFITFPGINDPNHYYNLGLRLLDGQGFTLDYLWHFYVAPETLTHPFDFWQPLAGILAAGGMWLFGESVQGALVPFVLLGSLLPLVSYVAAKQLRCSELACLFAALGTALLPEFVLNSLRTDTLIPNALFVGMTFVCYVQGIRTGAWWAFIVGGIAAGLAYLSRGDNLLLLPMLVVSLGVYAWLGRKSFVNAISWQRVWVMPLIAVLVITPWMIRNQNALGQLSSTPSMGQLMFYTDFRDHYAYERDFSLETLLAQQTIPQLISKRVFEGAAAIRMMLTTLDIVLPLGIIAGLVWVLVNREWQRLLVLMPPVVLLGGMYFAYVVLVPIANQGGSYKKSYLTLVPLLIPLAAVAIDAAITNKTYQRWLLGISCLLMLQSSLMFVVEDRREVLRYTAFLDQVTTTLDTLPDTNGDDTLVIMTQDPFALRYQGYQSVQIPMGDRDTVVEVADRYNVDYVLFPPARPALDGIYNGTVSDERFIWVADVNQTSQLYRIDVTP